MAEDWVSMKVFVMEGEKRIEVRRFDMVKSEITSYEYLCDCFQTTIPELEERVFTLFWLDSDGDEVTISSKAELKIALFESRDNVCKFILRLEPLSPSTELAEDNSDRTPFATFLTNFIRTTYFCELLEAELRTERVCNSCSDTAPNYKCLQCSNYYQCLECVKNDTHPNHIRLRISKEWMEQQKIRHDKYKALQERQTLNKLGEVAEELQKP